MSHRYRFLATRVAELTWQLDEHEWRHIAKVLRLQSGDNIELADGSGWTASAVIKSLDKRGGVLLIEGENFSEIPKRAQSLVIAIGALKPQSADDFIPSLVELGVDRIEVFGSHSGDQERLSPKVQERWLRIVDAAMKQCKRNWAPELCWNQNLSELMAKSPEFAHRLFLDPNSSSQLGLWKPQSLGSTLAVIGSEKGLHSSELAVLESHGFIGHSLQTPILRATTAAIAAAALLGQAIFTSERF